MHILVLDTIHGGKEIGEAFTAAGNSVVVVDLYRGTTPREYEDAEKKTFDLIVAPVHLDPDHPLARKTGRIITHHEAVRMLLGENVPQMMVEITGSRGKTTTAHALAAVMPGDGVLHTSTGTYRYPGKTFLWKKSITPASILRAANYAREIHGWLIAEESLGVTGAGNLSIITSLEDYSFASGKKSALAEKRASLYNAKKILAVRGITANSQDLILVDDLVRCDGHMCDAVIDGKTVQVSNPLLLIPAYRAALQLAFAAAIILHLDPTPLSSFTALTGRMDLETAGEKIIVDNSNSGTNAETTICAARYARHLAGTNDLTLVIGKIDGEGAVCEGFSAEQIKYAISVIRPDSVIWIGEFPQPGTELCQEPCPDISARCKTLEEGRNLALQKTGKGSVVLAVKTWR